MSKPDCADRQASADMANDAHERAEELCMIAEVLAADAQATEDACWERWLAWTNSDAPMSEEPSCLGSHLANIDAKNAARQACDEMWDKLIDAGHANAALSNCESGHEWLNNVTIWDRPRP